MPKREGQPDVSDSEKGGDAKLNSKYVYEAKGVPNDAAQAIEEWADAWGEYVWKCKIENQPVPPNDDESSDELKKLMATLEEKGEALEKLLPKPRFLNGVVIWDGGHVQLST